MKKEHNRPTDKLAYKVPMTNQVVTNGGELFEYYIDSDGIWWVYMGQLFSKETRTYPQTKVFFK